MTTRPDGGVLSLWVMRLNRPVFVKQQCEPAELCLDDIAGSLNFADAGVRADLDGVAIHRVPIMSSPPDSTDFDLAATDDLSEDRSSIVKKSSDFIRVNVGGPGELLSLPQSFGSTYLGETFSVHVNLFNESPYVCHNVELTVSLHNRIEWITLFNSNSSAGASIPPLSSAKTDSGQKAATGAVDLSPGQSLNAVIHHELKELGCHTLRCVASYYLASSPSSDPLASHQSATSRTPGAQRPGAGDHSTLEPFMFQRVYRFPVSKPLDVKKNFSIAEPDGSVLMEAQIQNLTSFPIYLERVAFEPNPNLNVIDLNSVGIGEKFLPTGQLNCLRPDGIRQLLYRLTPVPGAVLQQNPTPSAKSSVVSSSLPHQSPSCMDTIATVAPPNAPISAGRLDITWRSTMGERGRLQTSSLKYELPNLDDLQMNMVELPASVLAERPFKIVLELTNRSARHLDLLLHLRSVLPSGAAVSSVTDTISSTGNLTPPDSLFHTSASFLPPFVWIGSTTRRLGGLPPRRSIVLSLDAVATTPGLQTISGVVVHECATDRDFEFNNLGYVLVCSS